MVLDKMYLESIMALGSALLFGAGVVLVKPALRDTRAVTASYLTIGVNVAMKIQSTIYCRGVHNWH